MGKDKYKNLVGNALDDISGIPERETPIETRQALEGIEGKRKTKVVGVRIDISDIPNLIKLIKVRAGENSLSAGIRKILYRAMHEEGLL